MCGRVRPWHVATAVTCAVYFVGLNSYLLMDPDEGRYGEVSREMIERGDWVTPTLNYAPYFEKPPLLYWVMAASLKLFGEREWAVRLVPATCGALGLLVVWWLALVTVGREAARWAPSILGTTTMYFVMARIPIIDMLFSVLLAASLTTWWRSEQTRGSARWWWLAGTGGLLGLAALAKGPVSLVLFAGIAGVALAWRRRLAWVGSAIGLPMLAVCVVNAPWYLAVQARNPEFAHYYFIVQHVNRFLGRNWDEHQHSWYYFLPFVIFGCGFWSAFWPWMGDALRRKWPAAEAPWRDSVVFLVGWVLVVVGFFSASSSKLSPYVLPAWWPLGVGLAAWVPRALGREAVRKSLYLVAAAVGVCWPPVLAAAIVVFGADTRVPLAELAAPGAAVLCSALVTAGCFLWSGRVADPARRTALMAVGAAIALGGLLPVAVTICHHKNMSGLIPVQLCHLPAGSPWILAERHAYNQSFSFYTHRRIIQIDFEGETRLGKDRPDGPQWYRSGEKTIDELSRRGPLALVADNPEGDRTAKAHGLTVWARSSDREMLFNDAGLALLRQQPARP